MIIPIIAAGFGLLIIAVTIWHIAKNGVAKTNGEVETFDPVGGRNTEWTGDGF